MLTSGQLAKGFGNTADAQWNVEQDTINKNENLSHSPPTGTVSMTVNKRGRSATSAPYDAIKVTVKGIYNSGESFNTPASVHIQRP